MAPELLGSVEVFKTADMIEGGIAGTVSLNTRKPFDTRDAQQLYLSADMNYADLINKGGPAVSGLYTRNFNTAAGRFGIMVGGSYSQLFSRADGLQIARFQQRFNGSRDVNGDGVDETDVFPGLAAGQVVSRRRARASARRSSTASASARRDVPMSGDEQVGARRWSRLLGRVAPAAGASTLAGDGDGRHRPADLPGAGHRLGFDSDGVFERGSIFLDRGYLPTAASASARSCSSPTAA
ncbi:hypothetical protein AB5I41_13070 [Sphingomonas sp. MMS24-JH45]